MSSLIHSLSIDAWVMGETNVYIVDSLFSNSNSASSFHKSALKRKSNRGWSRRDSSCSENHQSWNYKLVCISMRRATMTTTVPILLLLRYILTHLLLTLRWWWKVRAPAINTNSTRVVLWFVSIPSAAFSAKYPFNAPCVCQSEARAESGHRAE